MSAWGEDLSPKQRKFVEEYLVDLNATQAAIRAGYSGKTARQIGQQNLSKLNIQEAIAAYRKELQTGTEVTPERIISEYAKLAFVNSQDFYDTDGYPIPIHQLPPDVAAAISGFEIVAMGTGEEEISHLKKVRWHDKRAALDSLSKVYGMFIERKELSGRNGGPIKVENKVDLSGIPDEKLKLLEEILGEQS